MFFRTAARSFCTLPTAATLTAHGLKSIEAARQAAEALRPLAGNGAYWLFMLGLIGTGILAIPVLAGSGAYGIAEALAWKTSLGLRPPLPRKFYAVVAVSMGLGQRPGLVGLSGRQLLF